MTAYPGIDICIEAIKRGAHDFIVKPFKSAYLFGFDERVELYFDLQLFELGFIPGN